MTTKHNPSNGCNSSTGIIMDVNGHPVTVTSSLAKYFTNNAVFKTLAEIGRRREKFRNAFITGLHPKH